MGMNKEALLDLKPLGCVKRGANQGDCCSYSSPYASQPFYQPQQSAIIETDELPYTPQISSSSEHSHNNNTSYNPAVALLVAIRNAISSTAITPSENTVSSADHIEHEQISTISCGQTCSCSIIERLLRCVSFDMCIR